MDFFKGDSKLYGNAKLLVLSPPAFKVMVFSWAWAADNESDGHVPEAVAKGLLGAKPKIVAELESAGLWERNGTGWVIHDWLEHQKSKAQLVAERAEWRERQTKRRSRKESM